MLLFHWEATSIGNQFGKVTRPLMGRGLSNRGLTMREDEFPASFDSEELDAFIESLTRQSAQGIGVEQLHNAVLESLERKRKDWVEILDCCPCCGEQHYWDLNPSYQLVSCGLTEALCSLDELPADIAVLVAFRIAGLRRHV